MNEPSSIPQHTPASLREARGLPQRKMLAERADMREATVARVEAGIQGVAWETLHRLASALDVPVEDYAAAYANLRRLGGVERAPKAKRRKARSRV